MSASCWLELSPDEGITEVSEVGVADKAGKASYLVNCKLFGNPSQGHLWKQNLEN